MDAICNTIDAKAEREELIEHLIIRHIHTLQKLDLADDSAARITGLPPQVLRSLHAACIRREESAGDSAEG